MNANLGPGEPTEHVGNWMEQAILPDRCPVCETQITGNYCSQCGQKRLQQRLSFAQLFRDVLARVFNWEKGWFPTWWAMFFRPGKVARDYVAGRQNVYVSPLAYFFLGAAAQLLMLWCYGDRLHRQISQTFQTSAALSQNQASIEKLEAVLKQPLSTALADVYLSTMQQGYTYVALLCFCLPWAVTLKFLNRLLGDRYRLGETMVYSLYITGHILFMTAAMAPLTLMYTVEVHMLTALFVYFLYPQWALTPFFSSGWSRRGLTMAATAIAALTFMASIVVVFFLSFSIYVSYCSYFK